MTWLNLCIGRLSYVWGWPCCVHIFACISLKRSNDGRNHHFRLLPNLMDCWFLVVLAVCRCDWMADFHHPVAHLRYDLSQYLDRGHHCFSDCLKCFGQGLDHFGHGRCDQCCLSFRYAYELSSLQHSIFGHLKNFRGSTAAERKRKNNALKMVVNRIKWNRNMFQ